MRDVVYILITVAFFAIAAGYVRACGRIIGAQEISSSDSEREQGDAVDAGAPAR